MTIWNTVVVLIASLLAMLAVREAMRITIENEARSLLQEEVLELELAINQLSPDQSRINDEFERKVLGHSQHHWFAALLAEDGTAIWKSHNFPSEGTAQLFKQPNESPFNYERTSDRLTVRYQLTNLDKSQRVIVIGEPTEFIRNDIWQLTKVMLYIGAVLLIVAPLGGYLLARRATSPVQAIVETTRSLDPTHLQSRLPIRGSGDELDQISTEINSFVDQIARYIKSQREFVANAAHELRSPITAIQTSVDVTLDKQRTIAEYQDELETVSEQCQELRHLVNQLLELAETDASEIANTFSTVQLTQLVEKSINVFSGVAEESEIEVIADLDKDVTVRGDESKLRQVINNLIDNALKFGPRGGKVEINLAKASTGVRLTFHDTGPGVPSEKLDKIFDRFYQVDQSRQRTSRRGNGLGLSICKSIVELHGGRITAFNGSTGFVIEIQL